MWCWTFLYFCELLDALSSSLFTAQRSPDYARQAREKVFAATLVTIRGLGVLFVFSIYSIIIIIIIIIIIVFEKTTELDEDIASWAVNIVEYWYKMNVYWPFLSEKIFDLGPEGLHCVTSIFEQKKQWAWSCFDLRFRLKVMAFPDWNMPVLAARIVLCDFVVPDVGL